MLSHPMEMSEPQERKNPANPERAIEEELPTKKERVI
jgi:hypothetical protein